MMVKGKNVVFGLIVVCTFALLFFLFKGGVSQSVFTTSVSSGASPEVTNLGSLNDCVKAYLELDYANLKSGEFRCSDRGDYEGVWTLYKNNKLSARNNPVFAFANGLDDQIMASLNISYCPSNPNSFLKLYGLGACDYKPVVESVPLPEDVVVEVPGDLGDENVSWFNKYVVYLLGGLLVVLVFVYVKMSVNDKKKGRRR